jgi:hypothetical protein
MSGGSPFERGPGGIETKTKRGMRRKTSPSTIK